MAKRFQGLLDLGLVQKEQDRYILIELPKKQAFLTSSHVLKVLLSSLSAHAISTYIYLINRYIAAGYQPYEFTLGTLKEFCGLGVKSRSNNYIITTVLESLQKLGLIKYHISRSEQDWKTVYLLDSISN